MCEPGPCVWELIFNRRSSQRAAFPVFLLGVKIRGGGIRKKKTYLPSFAVFEVDMLPFMWPKEVSSGSSCSTAIVDYDETETACSENPFSLQICAKLSKLLFKMGKRQNTTHSKRTHIHRILKTRPLSAGSGGSIEFRCERKIIVSFG